jgi:hypothetical protein
VTDVVPVGDYSVHIELYDINNTKRWSSPTMTHTIDDDVVQVGTIVVPVQ